MNSYISVTVLHMRPIIKCASLLFHLCIHIDIIRVSRVFPKTAGVTMTRVFHCYPETVVRSVEDERGKTFRL